MVGTRLWNIHFRVNQPIGGLLRARQAAKPPPRRGLDFDGLNLAAQGSSPRLVSHLAAAYYVPGWWEQDKSEGQDATSIASRPTADDLGMSVEAPDARLFGCSTAVE